MSELSAAGILQWWDQFNIDDMQEIFMTNYNTLRYEMREENGDFWFNHTSDTWFPTCLPFVCNSPVEEVSGEFKSREFRKYYKPLNDSHAIAVLTEWDEFKTYNWERIYQNMYKPAFVFDGRNILDASLLKSIGFQFKGIGKG